MTDVDIDHKLEALLDYLKSSRGFDFTGYKRSTLTRRITKRMQTVGIDDFEQYQDYLVVDPEEVNELFNTILINVTSFFRDKKTWDYVAANVIPEIIKQKKPVEPIRIWSAGCASGEEAYTIAILFAEVLGVEETLKRVKIYATDLDSESLTQGRQGSYASNALAEAPPEYVEKYFQSKGESKLFDKELRRIVVFGKHDLVNDIPISQIDLLCCRNTLMYFNSETQAKILKRLHFALARGGFVLLGKAEMLMLRVNDFEPVDVRFRVFRKTGGTTSRDRILLLTQHEGALSDENAMIENQLRLSEVAFEQDPLAQLVVDTESVLILANRTARRLFNISPENIGRPFRELEMSYHPVELHSLARQAQSSQQPVYIKDIELKVSPADTVYLELHVETLVDPGEGVMGVRYIFTNCTRIRKLQEELEVRRQELETAYEELQSSNEELTTTNEELQSTIEELETTNEELQSTNEELETMNEELQSTNEELETVNNAIADASGEIEHLNLFLSVVLNSLSTGLIVVTKDLKVLVWNARCEELWGLRAEEVLNEHLLGLDIGLPLDKLKPVIRKCLTENKDQPMVELVATNRRGRNVTVRVGCSPPKAKEANVNIGALVFLDEKPE